MLSPSDKKKLETFLQNRVNQKLKDMYENVNNPKAQEDPATEMKILRKAQELLLEIFREVEKEEKKGVD